VDELHAFEERGRSLEPDVSGGGQIDVVCLALSDSAAAHALPAGQRTPKRGTTAQLREFKSN